MVTKAPKDVSKEGEYLGKEWCPVVVGTVKEGWYSPNHHYVLFPLFEKWRRRQWISMMKIVSRTRSFIPILTHGRSWRRALLFSTGLRCLSQIRRLFLTKLPTNCFDQLLSSSTSVGISSMSVGIVLQPSEHDMLL